MAEITDTYTVPTRGLGLPDYSAPKPTGTVAVGSIHTLTDVGENAVRLGSIDAYDRRGSVVYLDDFEGPVIKWNIGLFSAAEYAILDSTSVKSGVQALKIHTSNLVNASVLLDRASPILASQSLGIEISLSRLYQDIFFQLYFIWYDGALVHTAEVRINPETGLLTVRIAGGWYEVGAVKFMDPPDLHLFDTVKLVVDFETGFYRRLMFNNTEYDISTIAYPQAASVAVPYLYTVFGTTNLAATGADIWVDDFILTQNEPANTRS